MKQNSQTKDNRKTAKLLSEPLLHFAVIALILFASFALLESRKGNSIHISQREINARVFMAELTAGNALTPIEIETIKKSYIEQQILVVEAKQRNLDNDSRIHEILDQKLRHVLSGDLIQPIASELREFYEANLESYRSVATVTVDELVLDNTSEPDLVTLAALQDGKTSAEILTIVAGSATPLPRVTAEDLTNIFNQELAEATFENATSSWHGPFLSNRGQHWLQVLEKQPAQLPLLEEISDLVRLDWMSAKEDQLLESRINDITEQYSVVIIDDSE